MTDDWMVDGRVWVDGVWGWDLRPARVPIRRGTAHRLGLRPPIRGIQLVAPKLTDQQQADLETRYRAATEHLPAGKAVWHLPAGTTVWQPTRFDYW